MKFHNWKEDLKALHQWWDRNFKIMGLNPWTVAWLMAEWFKCGQVSKRNKNDIHHPPVHSTASYYKMRPLRGRTPLLQNVVAFLLGDQPKTLPFLEFLCGRTVIPVATTAHTAVQTSKQKVVFFYIFRTKYSATKALAAGYTLRSAKPTRHSKNHPTKIQITHRICAFVVARNSGHCFFWTRWHLTFWPKTN